MEKNTGTKGWSGEQNALYLQLNCSVPTPTLLTYGVSRAYLHADKSIRVLYE